MLAQFPKSDAGEAQSERTSAKKLSWRSLSLQFFLLTIVPLTVLVLAVAFGSLNIHQHAMRTLVGERDERAVRTAAAALEEQFKHRGLGVQNLATMADRVKAEELPAILASFEYMLPEYDGGLAFFSPDGLLQATNTGAVVWESLSPQIASLIQNQKIGNRQAFLYKTWTGEPSDQPVVLVLIASPSQTWFAGGAFSIGAVMEHTLTNAFDSGTGASVIVIDQDGQLLYQGGSDSSIDEIGGHPGVAEALRGESGAQYMTVGSEEHVIAYSPVAPLGWAMVLEEPWELVESPVLRTSQLAPFILAPVLLLTILVLWFISRQIIRPLHELEARASMLAWGKFDAINEPVGGVEEIRQLQNELVHMAQKVQTAQKSLHSYIGVITAAQEDERRRLARELHDDTIQALIALKQRVQLAQIDHQTASSDSLREIAALTESTIENLRRLTRALRPIYLEDLGLVTALEMLARETGLVSGIAIHFERQGVEKRLDPAAELALYRIAQEALSNVTRHSQAFMATLSIRFQSETVTMQIEDNGRGFDVPKNPAEFAPSGHYGLLGLSERADLIGAALMIHSEIGRGTRLIIILPGV